MEEILKYFPQLDEQARQRFGMLYPLYKEWNEKINVISRKDIENLYLHHVLHSLAVAKYYRFEEGSTILDAGTGGGFPGIPLAILFPGCSFTLVDSIGKKIRVVQEVAKTIGLTNVEAIKSRVEEQSQNYDYVVSRAVTDLSRFYPWIKGKFKKRLFYLKGGDVAVEVETATRNCRIKRELIDVIDISRYFGEEYFIGKRIVEILR